MNTTEVTPDLNKFTQVELHIAPDPAFTRKFGQRVKQAGGRYSAVRGTDTRYVFLPLSEAKLIDEIIRFTFDTFTTRRTMVMIARDFVVHRLGRPSWSVVHYVNRIETSPTAWFQRQVDWHTQNAIERNIIA
jgi:hypothetical protein